VTEQQEREAFTLASEAVDRKLFRIPGVGHSTLLELEELITTREAARIRALPDADTMTARQAADAIDPEMRRRAAQHPVTVGACYPPQMAVLLEFNGNSHSLKVRAGDDHDRVDTVLLSTDDQMTIRYGLPPQPGQEPVGPPVPGRGRLLAHVHVPAGTTAIHPANITTYPWET
jgi:hypothetical protein